VAPPRSEDSHFFFGGGSFGLRRNFAFSPPPLDFGQAVDRGVLFAGHFAVSFLEV